MSFLAFGFFLISQSSPLKPSEAEYVYPKEMSGMFLQAFDDRYITLYRPSVIFDTYTGNFTEIPTNNNYLSDYSFIDPVASPAGKFFTYPNPLRFYRLKDALAKGKEIEPIFEDKVHRGWYQSIGILDKSANGLRVRVLTSQDLDKTKTDQSFRDVGAYRDYEIVLDANGDPTKVSPKGNSQTLCGNLGKAPLDWSTPIISKDGKEFGILDTQTKTTKIYRIKDGTSGDCELVEDLGLPTSKVNFSFDGKKIAFNASVQTKGNDAELELLANQVIVYDRKTRAFTPVVSNPSTRAAGTYPTFLENGDLVYIRTEIVDDKKMKREMVRINPAKFENELKLSEANRAVSLAAISKLVASMSVQPKALVCDPAFSKVRDPHQSAVDIPESISKNCVGCHNRWSQYPISFENPNLLSLLKPNSPSSTHANLKEEAIAQIKNGRMPMGKGMSEDDKKEALKFLGE